MKTEKKELIDFLLNESFQRYVLGATKEDNEYWESWVNDHPDDAGNVANAREIITFIATKKVQPKHQTVSDEVFKKLQEQINAEKIGVNHMRKTNRSLRIYWYAASIVLFIGLAFLFKSRRTSVSSDLAGRYLEVIVPKGQRSQLVLPDGTKVWLNSGSLFKYPAEFLQQTREVYVEGEAFFDVKHDKNLPFIVHMKENLFVRVLGTEFNVKCYNDDKIIETTLVKGNINLVQEDSKNRVIQELKLTPNEKATYQKANNKLEIDQVLPLAGEKGSTEMTEPKVKPKKRLDELELITAWKNDALVFHDETFEEIGVKMERWFGMQILITDEDLKHERFTGKFVNKETIYQILDIFDRSEPIRYTIKGKEIIITKR